LQKGKKAMKRLSSTFEKNHGKFKTCGTLNERKAVGSRAYNQGGTYKGNILSQEK